MARKTRKKWKLINIKTSKIVCRGYTPNDLLSWYHSNHFDSWYYNGRYRYNMVVDTKTKRYFI